MSSNMSESGVSVEEIEFNNENEILGGNVSYTIDNRSLQLFSMEGLVHRLLHFSNDVNNDARRGYDVVTDFLQRKKTFLTHLTKKHKIISKRNLFSEIHNLTTQIERTTKDSCIQIPSYISNLATMIEEDPDNDFFGDYNWYYTGGCLQHLLINEDHHIAYVGGRSRNHLYVAPVKCDSSWHVDTSGIMNVSAPSEEEIFQVKGVESSPHNFIGVRQKHSCLVYCCVNEALSECFNVVMDIPFTSFDISSYNEEVCTISVNKGLSFWDINRQESPTTVYFPSDNHQQDKWHNLWYSADPSVVALASRKSLKWMDRRSSNVNNSVKLASFKGIMDAEDISLHFASERSPYLIYVGTDVHLLMVDIRSPMSVIHRWPHHFESPPLYNCIISCGEENEIAAIGNHSPGRIVLAFSNLSNAYPLAEIPSRNDTLLSCQASGLCLDPSLKPRMTTSLTGLTSLKGDEFSNIEILTLTAASDIFSQALFDQDTNSNAATLNGLRSSVDTLSAEKRWNMTKLFKALSNTDLKFSKDLPRKNKKQKWQLSVTELTEYKDVLSSIILAEWDINNVHCQEQTLSSEQKVNAWLDMNNF